MNMQTKPEAMTEDDLVNAVKWEFNNSMGMPGGDIARERDLAWQRYTRQMLGNEVEGESTVMTSDVQEVMDGLLAGLMRLFAQADNLCFFEPTGPEDVEAAEQESDIVNHVFWKDNPHAFVQLFFWFFDTLYAKVGISMAWWDETWNLSEEDWEGLTPEKIEEMTVREGEDKHLTMEPVLRSEPYKKMVPQKGQGGQTVEVEVEVFDVVFRRREATRKACWKTVPPEQFRVSKDTDGPYTSCGTLRGLERMETRSKLIQMGADPDFVNSLPKGSHQDMQQKDPSKARTNDGNQSTTSPSSGTGANPRDRAREQVLYQLAYINIDFDGDGYAELRQVHLAGGKLMKWADGKGPAGRGGMANMMVHRDPFHVMVAHPLPHQFYGRAAADDEVGTQEITATLLRQTLNNLYRTNNPRDGVAEHGLTESTMEDLANVEVGTTVRFARNPSEVWTPMTVPFTAQSSFGMLDYFDQKKYERHGIRGDAEALDAESLKHIQKTVMNTAMDIREEKRGLVARFFAETGIRTLLLHLHELTLRHAQEKRWVRLRNRWVEVDKEQWRHRYDMTANIGVGIGSRDQQSLMLEKVSDMQMALKEAGMENLVVKPQHFYNTAIEITKLAKIPDPTRHFSDPGPDATMPAPNDVQMEMEKREQELQARQQQLDAERQQNAQQKNELARQKLSLDHQREMLRMEEAAEARKDKFYVENQQLLQRVTELEVEKINRQEEMDLKKAKTDAEVDEIKARAQESRARTMETLQRAKQTELDADQGDKSDDENEET